jgi:DNA-binding GntR family transcriptional regulator
MSSTTKPRKAATVSNDETRFPVRRTLTEQTYEILKEMILDQDLEPGSRLVIDSLVKRLGVSTSPLREALAKLESERLVVSERFDGYKVAPEPSSDYLRDLIAFRLLMESDCALRGAPRATPEILAAMRTEIAAMKSVKTLGTKYKQYRKFVEADARFHMLIVESAGNQVMLDAYRGMHALLLQARLYVHKSSGRERAVEVADEHDRILKAFEIGDGAAAADALTMHLQGGARRLLSLTTPGPMD